VVEYRDGSSPEKKALSSVVKSTNAPQRLDSLRAGGVGNVGTSPNFFLAACQQETTARVEVSSESVPQRDISQRDTCHTFNVHR